MTDETYVPLSRGLLDHLQSMNGLELKVYLAMLLLAAPFDARGRKKGSLSVTMSELSELLQADRSNIAKAVKGLTEKRYISRVGKGKNQFDVSKYTITKYKSVTDFAVVNAVVNTPTADTTPNTTPNTTALPQRYHSVTTAKSEDTSIDAGFQTFNNIENIENSNTGTTVPPNPLKGEPIPYQKIVSLYNEICVSMPKVQKLEERKRDIAARWKANPSVETFEDVFRRAEASDFLAGRTDRWQGANFDWLMKPKNFAKVLEGNYSNRSGNPRGQTPGSHLTGAASVDEAVRRMQEAGHHDT